MSKMNNITTHENLIPYDGEVFYYPGFFSEDESTSLFTNLINQIEWRHEPIKIFGKEIMQPRLTAWYGDDGMSYKYSGVTMEPLAWTTVLIRIKEKIDTETGHQFNSALLNYYRDGKDSMGWHRDNEKSLGMNPVIGSVSFGSPRTFQLKHAVDKLPIIKLVLGHGSLLLMKGTTQHNWLHSIPKEPKISEGRINITFRTIIK